MWLRCSWSSSSGSGHPWGSPVHTREQGPAPDPSLSGGSTAHIPKASCVENDLAFVWLFPTLQSHTKATWPLGTLPVSATPSRKPHGSFVLQTRISHSHSVATCQYNADVLKTKPPFWVSPGALPTSLWLSTAQEGVGLATSATELRDHF